MDTCPPDTSIANWPMCVTIAPQFAKREIYVDVNVLKPTLSHCVQHQTPKVESKDATRELFA